MKLAIIGITGRIGSRIATEALNRGHSVTGFARNPGAGTAPTGVTVLQGDAGQPEALATSLRGFDAVVAAGRFASYSAGPLVQALRLAGVKRVLVVGGAGSLEVAPGVALVTTPGFPEAYKPEASAGLVFLNELRRIDDLEWTFFSPAAEINPGERTGTFRLGGDALLTDAEGHSRISMEDYAIAAVDELEAPKNIRKRFTIAY
ncbi:NAD(P)-dependent oxidoreductase [Ferrovibrio sp.]|uniref:NAD(P)-dependent oxidoreductase n=1 Tax=Ferrovibrio sp. TaxID=1917215 RepID=UPI001B6BFC64|nr:NAD(P)-dependent oxidoreductase [Ferrovibrio sp.]MBP7066076.1 NAD(P)-dependent oxidoreductase [Ferrovibrio sp.]